MPVGTVTFSYTHIFHSCYKVSAANKYYVYFICRQKSKARWKESKTKWLNVGAVYRSWCLGSIQLDYGKVYMTG